MPVTGFNAMKTKSAKWHLVLSILALVIASCSQGTIQQDSSFTFSPDVSYTILRNDSKVGIGSLDVRLNRSVAPATLEKVSREIVDRSKAKCEITYILYYLPDMQIGNGAWSFTDTSGGNTTSYHRIGPKVELRFRALCTDSINDTNTGPTEEELVEMLAFLEERLLETETEFRNYPSRASSYEQKILEVKELLMRKREDQ